MMGQPHLPSLELSYTLAALQATLIIYSRKLSGTLQLPKAQKVSGQVSENFLFVYRIYKANFKMYY